MDVPRTPPNRRTRRIVMAAALLVAVSGITLGLSRLKPAAPSVAQGTVWVDRVQRGSMLREVRGTGSLVPVHVRWIAAGTEGIVEQIRVFPGTPVHADTILLDLSNSELELSARDAELQLKSAEADYENERARLENQQMDQQAQAASVKSDYVAAQLRAEADEKLAKDGLVADINLKISRAKAEELAMRYELEQKRLQRSADSIKSQLSVAQARVDQMRALLKLRQDQVEALHVRAGNEGVLQQLPLQVGQRVAQGATLALVSQPEPLKAELKIAETQAKDVLIGQSATIDTRNGMIQGKVMRIDPAVQNGTVTVDVSLDGALPRGARPDLTVDGTIELERLENVLYVGRPVSGQEQAQISLFKLEPDGSGATRVKVRLGRSSVNTIEIVDGLREGDRVILSDMSQWDEYNRIRLN